MDSKLIDALLIELLQLPAERRTPEKILANLTMAATAAGLSLNAAAPLQSEHLQLSAALERRAADLGDQYRARAMLRLGGDVDGIELCAVIEPQSSASPLPRFVAFGSTARSALAGINAEIRKAKEPSTSPTTPRAAGKLRLKRLEAQLSKATEAAAA